MAVSAGKKKADLQKVGMLSSLREISVYYPKSAKPLGSLRKFLSYRTNLFIYLSISCWGKGGGGKRPTFLPENMAVSQKVSKMWNIVRNV